MSKRLDGSKAVRASKETATPLPDKKPPAVELSEMPETPALKLPSGKFLPLHGTVPLQEFQTSWLWRQHLENFKAIFADSSS